MAADKFDQLYDALKADGAVSGTRENFRSFVYAPGKQGYLNRKKLYDALHADGAVSSNSYEEFGRRLGLHAVKPAPKAVKPVAGNAQPATTQQTKKPATTAQKAMQMAQGQQTTTATPSGTDYMKNWELLHKRDNQMSPLEQTQVRNMRARMQTAQRQAAQQEQRNANPISRSKVRATNPMASYHENMYWTGSKASSASSNEKENAKILNDAVKHFRAEGENPTQTDNEVIRNLSTPDAQKARAVQQRMDDAENLAEYEIGGNRFTHNDGKTRGTVGDDIFGIVDASMKEADELTRQQWENELKNESFPTEYSQMQAMRNAQDNEQKNRQEILMKNMNQKIMEIYSQKGMQDHIVESANKLNMGVEEYVDKYVTKQIMSYAQKALSIRNKEEMVPRGTLDYIARNLSNTIAGMIVAPTVLTKDTRQRIQEGIAIADGDVEMEKVMGHKDNTFRSGVGTRFLSTATNMAVDAGPLKVIGAGANAVVGTGTRLLTRGLVKAGVMKAGAKLTADQLAFKVANMTMAQKITSGLGTRVATSSLNLAGYSGVTAALSQASTGDDTSLAAIGKAGVNGAVHGGTTGAIFGFSGAIMAPWVSKFGINGMETNKLQKVVHGAQKFGASAAGLGVEAGTMMVADNITGDKDISIGTWLEDVVMVGAFKAGEPSNYAKIGSALHGLTHKTDNTFRFGKDDNGNWRTVNIRMTKDEQNELKNSVSGKNLVEAFSAVDRAGKTVPRSEGYKGAYNDFMNDPNVSQSTKEKVNAAMGLFNTTRDRSYRSVNDVKNKQVLEYSKNGTLLTRTSYKNAEERRAIIDKQNAYRDNDEILSLVGQATLKDRQLVDEDGRVTPLALRFLMENGYDTTKSATEASNAAIIANLSNQKGDLYKKWVAYADEHGMVSEVSFGNSWTDPSTLAQLEESLGGESTRHDLHTILAKDPMKRTAKENVIMGIYRSELEKRLYPIGKPHAEQSESQGLFIAADNNLGTEQPNGEAVKTELNGLKQAENEADELIRDNDIFGDNFEKLKKQGLSNPQIYDWMIQNGMTQEQMEPFARYINANARVQGMQQATQQKIDETAKSFAQDWTYRDKLNGVGMQNADGTGETVLFVYHDGKELIVGSGDVSFGQPNEYGIRRAKEDVGDMLVCLDPTTNEIVYVKASDVEYSREMKPEELLAQKTQELQQVNSQPYNEAAQEQAMEDAAKTQQEVQPKEEVNGKENVKQGIDTEPNEGTEATSGNDGETKDNSTEGTKPVETPTDFSISNGKGRIVSYKSTPHEKAKSDGTKEITFSSEVTFTQGAPKGRKEGEVRNIGDGGGFIKVNPEDIDYQAYAVSGRLHEDGTALSKDEATEEDIAEAKEQIDILLTPQLAEDMGPQYNVKKIIIAPDGRVFAKFKGLDGNIPMKRNPLGQAKPVEQPQPTTRKFSDGTDVPMTKDSKGRPTPDYGNMKPDQAAEILTEDFGDNAEKVVDGQIKKAEKALKDAEKIKVDYTAELNDIKEQEQLKAKTIDAAKKQLEQAENIKKAMTAKKVAETMGKPAEKTEGANEAGSVAAEKFAKATRLKGNHVSKRLPTGEKISGHYEIVPAESLTPSHDVNNGYKKSEGFPVDNEGRTINDRDYEHDKSAQQTTDQMAQKYSGQAITQVPTVSDEGIVYDGNGRTMAGQKAAKDGTDKEYIEDLMDNTQNYGFTKEQIAESGIEHPRLVMVTDERLPYDTATFAKFNRNEKKSQSNTEQAVAKAKTLTADEVGAIVADIEGNGSLDAFFNNSKAINDLVKTLVDKGVIGQNEVAGFMDGTDKLSAQGKEYVRNLLLGSVFKPETIRMLGVDSKVKNAAINGIRPIMDNLKLGDYSLRDEIDNAVQLLYEARRNKMSVDDLLKQNNAFDENARDKYSQIAQAIAQALEGKTATFRELMSEYNDIAKNYNTNEGSLDFYDKLTPEQVVDEFIKASKAIKNNNIKLYGNETGHSETENGHDATGHEEPAKEAGGAVGTEGNGETESQRGVDEALKAKKEKPTDWTDEEVDKLSSVESEWSKKIDDYIEEHYPNHNGVRSRTPEEQAKYDAETEAMKNDATLAKMRKDADAAYKATEDEIKSNHLSKDPMQGIKNAAESYHDEKIDAARKAYAEAKEGGKPDKIKHAAGKLKALLNEKYKAQGMGFVQRQKEIAKEIGKAEAEKIDKPWEQMDLEEREAVSSKNPLTEDEINDLTSEENKELIPAALAYLRGDKGNIINAISYFKIWNDVRNRHENVSDNSGAENGTQLDAANTTGSEGLGLGTGRESRGADGQLDRGTGSKPSSGEPEGRESDQNNPSLSAGEQGDKQGEGKPSDMGAVPARDTNAEGSGATGENGNVSERKGRRSGNRPAKQNAKRKPTAKQGTHFPNSTAEQLKKEKAEYEKQKADFWARWKKAGQGYVKIALTPFKKLNLSPEQIEMLPEMIKIHLKGAVLKIKDGLFRFKEWKAAMLAEEGKELKMIGLTDDDVDRFVDDYWNTPFEMDGESHTIGEWADIYGNEQLREKLKTPLNEKYQKQMEAEPIKVKVGDRKNIEETLPFLLPQQQEDVLKAETQFFGKEHTDREHAYGKGYMFTNGTGTGKTYTGLGIAKRLAKQGKGRILFVTPSQKKVSDWIKDGRNLGLEIRDLDSIAKEKGTTATTESGEGMVITTFANFGLNKKLLEENWDAVIYDECHRIMENKKGAETARSAQHYMVTNRDENHCFLRLQTINPHYQKMQNAADKFAKLREKEIQRIQKEYKQSHPSATTKDVINATHSQLPKDLNSFAPADGMTFPKLGKAYQDFTKAKEYYYNNVEPKLKEQAKNTWKNTKTVFLSATPFNTRENLDYAEGYIFKYPESDDSGMSGRSRFYLDHFGAAYKYRYRRLESSISNPEAVAKQEIAFSDYLQNTLGTMSGRIIDSPYDYSRDFPTVSPDHAEEFNNAVEAAVRGRYLGEAYSKTIGDYNYGSALFETMKVANIIERMKEHLDAGRKIVVFHRRVETKEPIKPPFAYMLEVANNEIAQMKPGKERDEYIAEVNEFRNKYADLLQWEQTLDYSMPREQIAKVFGKDNVLYFSGKESKKEKNKAVDIFNDDDSGKNIIVIQEASGKEGISLHDMTGKHQRVCITLGLPQSPITALQIEGRTYRIGNKSNAIFEYPILGLNSEMMLFGQKFNNQVSTTENLALGSQARNLRDSFANGILEHSGVVPIDQQGVGGKEFDAPKQSDSDPFDDAVLDYYSNQKLNRNNREGKDYFPTPEPLGYKMAEWANMGEGDTALEPSAGHGAIARYVPKSNELLSIEPSQSLFSRLQLKAGGLGRKFLNTTFENYNVANKHDVVVMNPPFGTAGTTAIAHLDKAFKHLDEGGRVVAIIPRGSTDKKFDKWFGEQKNAAMRAEVDLPDIVFQQAGTNVRCRVVVLDKISDANLRSKAGYPEKIDLSGHYDKIEDFFEDLRDIQMPDRIIDTQMKAMKKARPFKKDIEDIKGMQVSIEKNGISVYDKNRYVDYSINFPSGKHNEEWTKENYSKAYERFDHEQALVYNENSRAALDEMKKLACKLAGMSEDEMKKYISDKKNRDMHNDEERGVQYSSVEDSKDVKNERIIPSDVDKSVSSQIEKKFDDAVESVYGRSLTPEEKSEVERIANTYRNTPLNDEFTREENGNRKYHGGLETAIKTWEERATEFENYYGITRNTKLTSDETPEGGRPDGVPGVSSESQGERRLNGRDRENYEGIPKEDVKYYQEVVTNLAAAKRALEYHQERTRVLSEQYGVKHDEWLRPETIDRIFKDFNSDKSLQEVYDRIKDQVNNLGIYFGETYGGEKNVEGFYRHSLNDIRINLDRLVSFGRTKQELASTILHEMLHPLTSDVIAMYQKGHVDKLTDGQKEAAKEAVDIFNELKQMQADGKIGEHYALTNAREMITELASPEWRNALAKIPEGKSLWKRFVNSICKMLGFDPKYNKLGELSNTLDKLLTNFGKEQFDFATKHQNELFTNEAQGKKVTDKDELDRLKNGGTHYREDNSPVKISDKAPVVVKHVAEISKKVGANVNMVNSLDEISDPKVKADIEAGKKVTGWYDEKTGEVHLYMPNIHDRYTAEKTIWHETVGHKGMRNLIGEDRYDKFLDEIYQNLDKPEYADLKKLVEEERKYNPFNYRDNIEEGIARLAEEGRGEAGFWQNIKNKVSDMLHEIGYRIAPNTKNVKYLLWLSKNLQKNPNDPYWKMKADAVRYRLDHENTADVVAKDGVYYANDGKNHTMEDMTKAEFEEATDGRIHYRTTPSAGTAIDRYNRALNAHGYMFTESYMDNMLSLQKLMQAIVPGVKIEDIKSSENPYILQNTMQGAMSDASVLFQIRQMDPLTKAVSELLGAFDGKSADDKEVNLNLYMIRKHGLERNRVFFVRDYINTLEPTEAKNMQKAWSTKKDELGNKLRKGNIDLREYYDQMDEWIRNNVDAGFKADEHDYSGFHGMYEIDDNNAPYNDADVIADVMDSEAKMEDLKTGSVKNFWSKVHAATSFGLYTDYKGGSQDRETYTKTSQMFDWYVPLRKFDETTAEDIYGYINEKGDPSDYIGSVLMSAKGRKSLSETNILAQIGAMGNAAIYRAGNNVIKQAFMRFARNHDSQGLITEGKVWLVKDGTNADGSDRWVETYPQIPDNAAPKTVSNIISKFEADMKAKEATGDAKVLKNKADIGFRFERAKDKNQHAVDVMVNGQTHRFYINGNPRAAQALNGLLKNWNGHDVKYIGAAMRLNSKITRFFAQACTSYNPEFTLRNMVKDYEFSTLNLLAKEGAKYTGVFEKYYLGLVPFTGMKSISLSDLKGSNGFGLFAKYRNGKLDMNNKVERYFKEFMENGGETGFVQMLGMKDWTKKYKAEIKSKTSNRSKVAKIIKDGVFGNIEGINEVAENMARFATYCASRDAGRSAVRSAYDAKEVTVNFNRQGSGSVIGSFKNGEMSGFKKARRDVYGFTSCWLRNFNMFFNAGIQSTNMLLKNAKSNPIGTAVYIATGPAMLGALMPLVNQALMAMLDNDEKDRHGVKDPYAELPDYVRRNNLCIYTGKGEFVTIPLAIETRAFYGLGDLAADLVQNPEDRNMGNIAQQATGQIAQLVPVMDYMGTKDFGENPMEATFQAFAPSSIEPLIEWERNKDWKGQQIERRGEFYKNDPAWERANSGTNSTLMKVNQFVNAQTNDVAKGNDEMLGNESLDAITNPSMLEHFGGGITKGMGTFGGKVAGVFKKGLITHEKIETRDIPFVRSFFYTPSETSSMQRTKSKYYNYSDELSKDLSNVKKLKSGTKDPVKALQNSADYYNFQNSKKAEQIEIFERANKQIKDIKKMRKKQTDPDVIRWSDQQIGSIMQKAVEDMDKLN